MDKSVVSRCGLLGMLPSTGEACPESLLSVILIDKGFLVDTWAPSVILLPKLSQEPLHEPWITIPLKSPSTGTTFCVVAISSISGHQFSSGLCGSTAPPPQLQRARAAVSSPRSAHGMFFHTLSLAAVLVGSLEHSEQSKRSALPFCNFGRLFFALQFVVTLLWFFRMSQNTCFPFPNYKRNKPVSRDRPFGIYIPILL